MYRKDFIINDKHYYVDLFINDCSLGGNKVYMMTVTVEDEEGDLIKKKEFEFDKEKEAKQFIEDLREGKIDLL